MIIHYMEQISFWFNLFPRSIKNNFDFSLGRVIASHIINLDSMIKSKVSDQYYNALNNEILWHIYRSNQIPLPIHLYTWGVEHGLKIKRHRSVFDINEQ